MRTGDFLAGSRRGFLKLGAYGALSAVLAEPHRWATAADTHPDRTIRSCILLMYYGGPSHVDTWDLKPAASVEFRSAFRPIATSVPGRFVCEHLPKTARIMDKLAVIRSMHHPMTNHNAAMYEALVGRVPLGGDNEILGADRQRDFPSMGAVVSSMRDRSPAGFSMSPLDHVALPHVMFNVVPLPGQNSGFLGAKYDPLQIVRDPNEAGLGVEELTFGHDMTADRLWIRNALLASMDRMSVANSSMLAMSQLQRRAYELVGAESLRTAFELAREPNYMRDRYGRHRLGQSLLLARRLVEANVRFVNVNDKIYNGQLANWDSHQDNFIRHKNDLLPPADEAFSALIEDLDDRGLLDTTLVVAMGEFGRTPRINSAAGRDHWPHCYSVVLAGGRVRGGATYGESDRIGAYPISSPATPGDLAATIFWRFGMDHRQELTDPLGKFYRLADGEPIRELFSVT